MSFLSLVVSTITAILTVWVGIVFLGIINLIFLHRPTRFIPDNRRPDRKPSAQILVLGDIGRSPRMQYHALSIANHGGEVQLIGYHESALLPALTRHEKVKVHGLGVPESFIKKLPFPIAAPLKIFQQLGQLLSALLYATEPAEWLIVQNPPSIPTLIVAWLVCSLRSSRLLIDWHNYGWTILAGTRGENDLFVRVSKVYECFLGRLAPSANLTVTHAMKNDLLGPPYNIKSPIETMHDRPAEIFQPIRNRSERQTFVQNIEVTADFANAILNGSVRLLVSSTSWTPDEDFSILLDALVEYAASPKHAPLLVIITGRGPQKAMYEAKVSKLTADGRLPNITIRTAFLSFEDYANLLAAADLGICLHMSSSGVDLPMKVVDMFGAGLPVLAYSDYPSFSELVEVGENGSGFETSAQLSEGLLSLLDLDSNGQELAKLKKGAVKESTRRWDVEWDKVVKPLLGFK